MLTYRVEHPEFGNGPWRFNAYTESSTDEYESMVGYLSDFGSEWDNHNGVTMGDFHPSPCEDGMDQHGMDQHDWRDIIFAAWDIAGVKHWFGAGRCPTLLMEAGMMVAVYDVPDDKVEVGATQVAFDKNYAKLVKYIPLTDIFPS